MAAHRRTRRRRPGERDTFPLKVAALLAGMLVVVMVTLFWAVSGGRGNEPVQVAEGEAAEVERTAPAPLEPAEPAAGATAAVAETVAATGSAQAAGAATAVTDARTESAEPLTVVRTVAAPPMPAPRRPMAPADTTAAGHAGLAEDLLAAGDTAAAIAAYSAFLARNTDPDRERAVIAKLREIGVSRRSEH